MASKIRELKDIVNQQNEAVKTLREDKRLMRDAIVTCYTSAVKYKPEFSAGSTAVEDSDYPDIKAEDMAKIQSHELMKRLNMVLAAVIGSLESNREEVRAVYRELDEDVNNAMSTWQQLQIQEKNDRKAETFRNDLVTDASKARSKTPDLVATGPDTRFGPALPPTPPTTAGKKDSTPTIKVDKSKSGTTTLEQMLSPTSDKHKKSDTPSQKSSSHAKRQ